jgi:large subunit ribosomal protein L23
VALFDFFKKRKEKERFEKKRRRKETAGKPAVFEKEKKDSKTREAHEIKEKVIASDLAFKTLLSPHVTEKTAMLGEGGVAVFKAKSRSNKIMVKKAIEELYGVHVRKVNISKAPSKKRFVGGKYGVKPGYKKAIVFFNKGEKIEL